MSATGQDDDVTSWRGDGAAASGHGDSLRVFRLLSVVAHQLRWLTDDMLRGDGLTSQQAALVTVINQMGKPSMSEVADVLATSHQNVKQIAVILERKGFVRIVHDDSDGRVRRLETTRKSDKYWASRDSDDFTRVGSWFARLSSRELQTMALLLDKVHRGLAEEVDSLKSPTSQV